MKESPGLTWSFWCWALLPTLLAGGWLECAFGSPLELIDAADDTLTRRSDPGADGPCDASDLGRIDLLQMRLGAWTPVDAYSDPFGGTWDDTGQFIRLDVDFAGVVNPPGPANPAEFQPLRFGPRPVYGFIEIDVDASVLTGGEVDYPEYRYLGNISRFGGRPPRPELQDRVAPDAAGFDHYFPSAPFVERHGEEFHLAFIEEEIQEDKITRVAGNADFIFEAGETWNLDVEMFHRAHGFEPFSLIYGGEFAGEYEPDCLVRFQHNVAANVTTVSLVYPLTPAAAGLMEGDPAEPIDSDASNQTCVLEALTDLRDSALFLNAFPSGLPEEALIEDWKNRTPNAHLDPSQWTVTAVVGAT